MNQWEALELYINFARLLVERDRRIQREIKMATLASIADRLTQTNKTLDDEADGLATKLNELDKIAPDAIANAHAFIDAKKAEVLAIEATLKQLSNLPLAGASTNSQNAPQGHYVGEQLKG